MNAIQKILLIFIIILFYTFNQSFGVNVTITLGDNAYIKITSEKNISSTVNKLNLSKIDFEHNDDKYIWYLKTNWNKKTFIYNFSPLYKIGKFNYSVECDKYLLIKNESFKNGVLRVDTQLNYKTIFLGLTLFIFLPIFGAVIITIIIKRMLRKKPKTLEDKITKNKKIALVYMSYWIVIVVGFILSLFLCDIPSLIAYFTGISLDNVFYILIIIFVIEMFLPTILILKYLFKFNNKKIDRKEYFKSIGVIILPWILGFLGIMVLSNIILFEFGKILSEFPHPIRIAFWMFIGYVSFDMAWKIIKRYVLKPEYVVNNEIIEMVNDLIKKLNAKPFKEIKIIKNDDMANAMVSGFFNEKLILTTKLIDILTKDELKSIIAHEIAHKKKNHTKQMTFVWFIVGILMFSSFPYIIDITKNIFGDHWYVGVIIIISLYLLSIIGDRYFSKRLEREADIIAAKIINPEIYIKALSKLHYANYIPKEGIFNIISTHPPLIKRIKYIQKELNIPEDKIKNILDEAYKEIMRLDKTEEDVSYD
ncbi:M48 family metalloprotease [Methanocaldococcus sp. 16A]